MHSKRDNIEIMMNDKADGIKKYFFDSLQNRFKNNLVSMKGSEFIFDSVQLLYYECIKQIPIVVDHI